LTFFDAQESEVGSTSILVKADEEVTSVQTDASNDHIRTFPDGLKEPVLRYAQHQDHERMDDLGESPWVSGCETLLTCVTVNDVFDVGFTVPVAFFATPY
jgi:hypothetical protein